VALPQHLHTRGSPPQSPVGHAHDFASFQRFVETNLAKFVVALSAQAVFRRLIRDFPVAHVGFHRLLTALADGVQINATTDGSKVEDDKALVRWIFWMCTSNNNDCSEDDKDLVDQRTSLMCSTILLDGQLANNTSFRAEAMGKLTVTILLKCLYDFIDGQPTIPTYL